MFCSIYGAHYGDCIKLYTPREVRLSSLFLRISCTVRLSRHETEPVNNQHGIMGLTGLRDSHVRV